jgi:hypothetical protein
MSLYVDNVLKATNTGATGAASSTATGDNRIGGYKTTAESSWFNGSIDQVRIYNTVLDSTDVSNLYAETASDTSTLSFPSGKTAIATYQLDGNSTDLSGNYNGTDTNITYAYDGAESNIEYRFGRYGQAAVFNGTNSYIYASNPVQQPTTNFSVSVWSKWDSKPSGSVGLVGNFKTGVTPQVGFALAKSNASNVFSFWADGTASSSAGKALGTTNFVTGQWYHTVGTYDGSNVKIYVNGALEGTQAYTATPGTTDQPLVIGRWYGNYSGYYHDGQIDQVRVFSSALTSNQVTQLYNEKPKVDTSNFKAVLYEGNGTTNYISNAGMNLETDGGLVWVKSRDTAYYHRVFDSVRGLSTDGVLYPSTADDADNLPTINDNFTSFDANGFTLGSTSSTNGSNFNGDSFVAWVWKGGGDAVLNEEGTIDSQVSANTEAGFSVVKYTGNNTDGATVGTGLTEACNIVIVKDLTSANYWCVGGSTIGNGENLYLNDTGQKLTRDRVKSVQTSTFTLGSHFEVNSSNNFIAYCFHSVAGYSKIGSYGGNSNTQTIITGFKPSFVMIKTINTVSNWVIFDDKRPGEYLMPSLPSIGYSSTDMVTSFVSNGFTLGADVSTAAVNGSGVNYIYMAFK